MFYGRVTMARKKPNDELNNICLELLEDAVQEAGGEAKPVAKKLHIRDGTLSKWRSRKQMIRSDCISPILHIYGGIPMDVLKKTDLQDLAKLLGGEKKFPGLMSAIISLIEIGDARKINHVINQINLLAEK